MTDRASPRSPTAPASLAPSTGVRQSVGPGGLARFQTRPRRYSVAADECARDPHRPHRRQPGDDQFFEAKARQPDALVFFRMGDFYELFFEDAQKAAEALGIALTARGTHGGQPIPMAGVPVHAAEA